MDGENVWFRATTVVPIEPGPVAQLLVRERPKRALGKKKTDVVDDVLLMYSGSLPFQNKKKTTKIAAKTHPAEKSGSPP